MKSSLQNLLVASVLAVLFSMQLMQMPEVISVDWSAQDESLIFLRDVVKLDMVKYNATLESNLVDYPPHWGGLAEEVVSWNLDWADESKLYVTCRFREKMLYSYGVQLLKGSPIFIDPQPTIILNWAKVFLERYQNYSGFSYIYPMSDMLETVDATKNATITSGNIKLTTSNQIVSNGPATDLTLRTSLDWKYTINGVDAPQNVVRITFDNATFTSFRDDWNLYKIGSAAINVSREEAVNMAREAARNYKLKIWTDKWIEVDFTVIDEPATAELSMYPRENLTVYPFWRIELYFDKVYYSAYGIGVGIWADTKEIKYCESLSYGGSLPDGKQQTTSPEGFLGTGLPMALGYAMIVITAVAVAATGYLYLKRKR